MGFIRIQFVIYLFTYSDSTVHIPLKNMIFNNVFVLNFVFKKIIQNRLQIKVFTTKDVPTHLQNKYFIIWIGYFLHFLLFIDKELCICCGFTHFTEHILGHQSSIINQYFR